ncbi:hypothetical protein PC129_g23408 [Phytophthora cactorum]|uniref:PH domain-containing protein n=1 Tax=Phytophthora cactorum TaxID=29920 RepID=A0A8T1AKT0_9STRA|nr:hypothetical protein Pcac1_g10469 [Phytophthora cactorum]KAG2792053.1 hypothetical protein PC111_g23637 [Phytophthora cactorum]KAG2792449.1 hypothetical protein PC112_g23858 [Phytophthora cactorum]KAG2811263.1 hypothetical protein PC113_g23680 [Phytophthora cactorum]KAG2872020.1 hypothetical protein PC114_g26607 [Phytophthora cactorum]
MTCGKLCVQACSLVWVLSTVYLVCTPRAKIASTKHTTQAIHNLVVERPRIAGGTLTIPLDSTVKFVKSWSKDIEHNIIRLTHGSNSKNLVLRAPSPQEREQWMTAIASALSTPLQSAEHVPISTARTPPRNAVKMSTKMRMAKCTKKTQPQRSTIHHVVSASTPRTIGRIPTTSGPPSAMSSQHTTPLPQRPIVPQTCSLRRIVRRNIPATMQLFITVGQIIASAG